MMNAMTVGLLKKNFSKILEDVKNGEEYTILYGRNAKPIAIISPIRESENRNIFQFSNSFKFGETNSDITEEELLGLL